MTPANVTISSRGTTKPSGTDADNVRSRPMTQQNSGAHGYEMYPQQFVRLVGCHDPRASALHQPQEIKLH
jgi:hypothetical protein